MLAYKTMQAGAGTQYRTRRNPWSGVLGRPGNEYQDSVSALSDLGPDYYTGFHTFGVDWQPGEVRGQNAGVRQPLQRSSAAQSGRGASTGGREAVVAERALPRPACSTCDGTSMVSSCMKSTSKHWWLRPTARVSLGMHRLPGLLLGRLRLQ